MTVTMTRLYIYYRVPHQELDAACVCARSLFAQLYAAGVRHSELLVRVEEHKPYATLMEVVQMPEGESLASFKTHLNQLAEMAFSSFSQPPDRVLEVFTTA